MTGSSIGPSDDTTEAVDNAYEQAGWFCHYHGATSPGIWCRSPRDCELTPLWRLTKTAYFQQRDDQERP